MDEWFIFSSENGTLYSSGSNDSGQLGLKDHKCSETFHKVPMDKMFTQISANDEHTLVLTGNFDNICVDFLF